MAHNAPLDRHHRRNAAAEQLASLYADRTVEWRISPGYTDYERAVAYMEACAQSIRLGDAAEQVWLLEHPPLYTGGTGAKDEDLRDASRFPVYASSRGGQYTYHGPGQRIAYAMLDLNGRGKDVRAFVYGLEEWIIRSLAAFSLKGERADSRIGVWIDRTQPGGPPREDKIAALGVRIRRWVSFHGIAINVEPDLSHFTGITPCGIDPSEFGVTSLVDLGLPAAMSDLDAALRESFTQLFGPVKDAPAPSLLANPQR